MKSRAAWDRRVEAIMRREYGCLPLGPKIPDKLTALYRAETPPVLAVGKLAREFKLERLPSRKAAEADVR